MPESLQRFAASRPTCLSQARLKAISFDASVYVPLVKSAWELHKVSLHHSSSSFDLQSMRNMRERIAIALIREPIL
jgi:hypothetical protein